MKMQIILWSFIFFTLTGSAQDTLSFYFEFDQYTTPQNKVNSLEDTTNIKFTEVLGYTDYYGTKSYNKELASKRIQFITQQLNIPPNTTKIVVGESTAFKERWKNRRVDLVYTTNPNKDETKEQIVIEEIKQEKTIIEEVKNLKKGETLVIKNMEFIPGRHVLTEYSYPELKKLLNTLKANPKLKIEIQGHICCQEEGDGLDWDTGREELSVNRAKTVYNYLIVEGISEDRLSYWGYGASKKLYPETSQENMQRNRRVEIMIVDK